MANKDERTPGLDDAESIIEMRQRHLSIGLRMQKLALLALEELEAKAAAGKPLNLTTEDAYVFLSAGEQLERDALGGKKPDDDDAPMSRKPN